MLDTRKNDEIAANRLKAITPLLDENLDEQKRLQIRGEVCLQTGLSDRTIRRYVQLYKEQGFEGLKMKSSATTGRSVIPEDLMKEIIQLRREVPKRSVNEIIHILEWESKTEPGTLRRSTVQDQLKYHGYSSRQMRMYQDNGGSSRRFQKAWRNKLWHSDIKYGPFINGVQMYMVAFIDDCTRYILHSEFYATLDQKIVQDCFRQALTKYGAPEAVYFDNGKQYRTNFMQRACGKLGIRLLYCKPYSPESKGKVERYNRTMEAFLEEIKVHKPKNITELNRLYFVWLDECYQNRSHSSLADKKTPYEAYQGNAIPLRMLSAEMIADAFLSCDKRKVDKSGCISFQGKQYELQYGLHLIGKEVTVVYDLADVSKVSIECNGQPYGYASPIKITGKVSEKPLMPETLLKVAVDSSRLLTAATKKNAERQKNHKTVLSFKGLQISVEKAGGGDV